MVSLKQCSCKCATSRCCFVFLLYIYPVCSIMAHSPLHGNDQWKISQRANHTTTQPSLSLGRSQSPFSRIDRYRPKSPIIKRDASPQQDGSHGNDDEQFYTPDSILQQQDEIKPVIVQQQTKVVAPEAATANQQDHIPWTWWSGYAFFLTCCIPNWALSALGGKKTKLIQQAWREKVCMVDNYVYIY